MKKELQKKPSAALYLFTEKLSKLTAKLELLDYIHQKNYLLNLKSSHHDKKKD